MRRIVLGSLAAMLIAATVSAAQHKSETAASISLVVPSRMVSAASSGIWPAIGDSVSFAVTFPSSAERYGPRIQVLCYQSGTLVYAMAAGYKESFQLGGGSSPWLNSSSTTGAHCVADLYYWSYKGRLQQFNLLASTEFDAAGR